MVISSSGPATQGDGPRAWSNDVWLKEILTTTDQLTTERQRLPAE
jgi:hypothetical protein